MPSRDTEYWTYYDGKYTHVFKTEDAVRAVLCRHKNDLDRIERLEEENKKLKEEAWKDEQLQEMKRKFDEMNASYWMGFPISKEEFDKIEEWKKKHEEEVHGLTTDRMGLKARGVSGGKYSYHFYPTSIGTSAYVKCICGAEYQFQEIG